MIKNTEHTKGPWLLEQHSKTWFVSSNSSTVGTIQGDTPEANANAHLICAAPELLQAADELISLNKEAGPTEWKRALEALARAVAKADGKE